MTTCWPEGEHRDRDWPEKEREDMMTGDRLADKDMGGLADRADTVAARTPAGPRSSDLSNQKSKGRGHTHRLKKNRILYICSL